MMNLENYDNQSSFVQQQTFGDFYSDEPEMRNWIHPFWRSFKPPGPMLNYAIGIYMAIVSLMAVTGNIAVLMITLSDKLHFPSFALIVNLASADMACAAINGFPLKTLAAIHQRWIWGKRACQVSGFAGGLLGFVSITTLTFIAIERYLTIVRPSLCKSRRNKCRDLVMILVIWLWSLIWAIPPAFGIGKYRLEGLHTSCSFDYLSTDVPNLFFNGGMYIFGFLIPLLVIAFCYSEVVRKVRDVSYRMSNHGAVSEVDYRPVALNNQTTAQFKRDVHVSKICFTLVVLFVLSWSPYAIICLMALVGKREFLYPITAEIPVIFAKTSTMYNPIVYAFMYKEFRDELWRRIPRCKRHTTDILDLETV